MSVSRNTAIDCKRSIAQRCIGDEPEQPLCEDVHTVPVTTGEAKNVLGPRAV